MSVQLTEALAADTVSTIVHGLRSAILRTKAASSSSLLSSRGQSRDQSRGQRTGSDVSRSGVQCKSLQTTLPHGRTLAVSLRQVKAKFRYAILVADRSEAGRRPAASWNFACHLAG